MVLIFFQINRAGDAAAGMTYLSKLHIVHRDLACRNLLVKKEESQFIVKVAGNKFISLFSQSFLDFGLSKSLNEEEYYVSQSSEFAWKWAAPGLFTDHVNLLIFYRGFSVPKVFDCQ